MDTILSNVTINQYNKKGAIIKAIEIAKEISKGNLIEKLKAEKLIEANYPTDSASMKYMLKYQYADSNTTRRDANGCIVKTVRLVSITLSDTRFPDKSINFETKEFCEAVENSIKFNRDMVFMYHALNTLSDVAGNEELTNVCTMKSRPDLNAEYADDFDIKSTLLFDSISKKDFIRLFMAEYNDRMFTVSDMEESWLEYMVNGERICISVANYTSDVLDEHFRYSLSHPMVITSVVHNKDLVPDYNDYLLTM